jgi:GNAT superfamily N-acetyltransferase
MTSWQVRPAVPDDVGALSRIFRAASLSNAGDRAALLAHPEVLEFDDLGVRQGRTRVVAGPDGTVVGFATGLDRDGVMEIEDLFVDPRWQRRGAARRLVEDLIADAAARGVQRVEVVANPEALAFYRSAGLVEDGSTETRFGPAPSMHRDLGTGGTGTGGTGTGGTGPGATDPAR